MFVLPSHRPQPRHRAPLTAKRLRGAVRRVLPAAVTRPAVAALVVAGVVGGAPAAGPGMAEDARAVIAQPRAVTAATQVSEPALGAAALDDAARRRAVAAVSRAAVREDLDDARTRQRQLERQRERERERERELERLASHPRTIARQMLPAYGWDDTQFGCLNQLWIGESNWDHTATNPTSGAYGIPQSLPAGKMASAGPDWRTNPATQIEWGLEYIAQSYGTPCSANEFKLGNGWY